MYIDLVSSSSAERYRALTHAVVPRPVAWVLSDSGGGSMNLAPFSYFTVVASDPPLLMVSVGHKRSGEQKDTWRNLEARKHFVVHIAHEELLDPLNQTAMALEHGDSELKSIGLATTAFDGFSLPRIQSCRLALACRLHQTVDLKDASPRLLFGRIERLYVDDEIVTHDEKGRLSIDASGLDPIARLGGENYASLGRITAKARPR